MKNAAETLQMITSVDVPSLNLTPLSPTNLSRVGRRHTLLRSPPRVLVEALLSQTWTTEAAEGRNMCAAGI